MFQMSSAQANQFAQAAQEMTDQIIALGPNPLKGME
jgi:coenzyme F420-reducing hydrogenase delta subunit